MKITFANLNKRLDAEHLKKRSENLPLNMKKIMLNINLSMKGSNTSRN